MSRKRSSEQRNLDLEVFSYLTEYGILNKVRSNTFTNLALEIQSSSLDSMKLHKTIKTDPDYKIASEIVFSFLKSHNMENTIRCIQSETNNKLRPTPISSDVNTKLKISEEGDVLGALITEYSENIDQISENYNSNLMNEINNRIKDIGKNKSRSPPKQQNTQPQQRESSKIQQKTNKSSDDLDFDLDDDEPPMKSSTKNTPKNTKTNQDAINSASSELQFDTSDNPPKPAASKPKTFSTSKANAKDDTDDFDIDFDDSDGNATPNKVSPNKTKNDDDNDFFDDSGEPPQAESNKKPPSNNDSNVFDDEDSLDNFLN